ncbi:MAG TPA: hypothetical protein VF970_03310 [Gemmatimonadales bacterium]
MKPKSAIYLLGAAGVILAAAAGYVPAQQKQTEIVVYKSPA